MREPSTAITKSTEEPKLNYRNQCHFLKVARVNEMVCVKL